MAVYSMTGYASGQSAPAAGPGEGDAREASGARLGLEIRAVNSRFLDLTFKLPEELRQHEPALRELLTRHLKRGKVELRAAIDNGSASGMGEPSPRLLQRLNAAQDAIKAWLPQAAELSVADVLRLAAQEGSRPASAADFDAPALAIRVLESLLDARAREGERLVLTLQERLQGLRALAQQAAPIIPRLVEQQRTRFLERWNEAMGLVANQASADTAQDRALAEATAFAIRIDVAEELTRLSAHLDEIERLLAQGGEIGKRLDFLIQELHREANTLGSKSAALELTRIGVDMKVLIEQMREQVQNIE
ncbi:YicC family protein [Xenophilus arseniciresistens]|uniref:YicC family protein n=1 Tax=Xenophilus arseniciresistens TaxID=1283306 RepID=A0AAE3N620_9BURK|nr:YicC/YloC family endoribonuclease [Xenophilus arseniciresistens]MDA7415533.1 YicC family protein [Xenophilus arseniciresistens]